MRAAPAGIRGPVAVQGQVLREQGGVMRFEATRADSGGALMATRSVLRPGFPEPPLHVHPWQAERFEVLCGRLVVRRGAVRHLLGPGEVLTVPSGVEHTFSVPGDEPVEVLASFTPALDMEGFLERTAAYARKGSIRPSGWPTPLAGLRLALEHPDDVRLAGLRGRLLHGLLGPVVGVYRMTAALRRGA